MGGMGTWQPIETAPKDGTELLLFGAFAWNGYDDQTMTGSTVGRWDSDERAWVASNANPYVDYGEPTHWMPLPDHPTEEG